MLPVPRGIIYHKLLDDFKNLFFCWFANLENQGVVRKFENEFKELVGSPHCVAFPYARVGIYYLLKSLRLPEGSEVIMPPISIKAILDVILDLKLKPVFVDIDLNSLSFDRDLLDAAINGKTRAIIVTYLFGIVPNVNDLIKKCRENEIFIIEDFSQCLNGSCDNKKTGTFGDAGVYSASSIKTLDTYGGGIVVCNSAALAEELKAEANKLPLPSRAFLFKKILTNFVRNLATTRYVFSFVTFQIIRVVKMVSPQALARQTGERTDEMLGNLPAEWFTKYTSFQAAVGLKYIAELEYVDSKRIANVEFIKKIVNDKSMFPSGAPNGRNVYWQFVAYFKSTEIAQRALAKQNIDCASTSLMKISDLKNYPVRTKTPNADFLYSNTLFVPAHPNLSANDLAYIANRIKNFSKI